MPLRTLVVLLDEALRALRRGGMVIFETPNLDNLVVGACNRDYRMHWNSCPLIRQRRQ